MNVKAREQPLTCLIHLPGEVGTWTASSTSLVGTKLPSSRGQALPPVDHLIIQEQEPERLLEATGHLIAVAAPESCGKGEGAGLFTQAASPPFMSSRVSLHLPCLKLSGPLRYASDSFSIHQR